jgi:hypothetical protein
MDDRKPLPTLDDFEKAHFEEVGKGAYALRAARPVVPSMRKTAFAARKAKLRAQRKARKKSRCRA